MHLNIKNDETYELAAAAARLTGKNLTQTVTEALSLYLERVKSARKEDRKGLAAGLASLADEFEKLPVSDDRDHAAMLYDEHGLPCSGGEG